MHMKSSSLPVEQTSFSFWGTPEVGGGSNFHICTCDCHKALPGDHVAHIAPCCGRTPCGLNIKMAFFDEHRKSCPRCREADEGNEPFPLDKNI